MADDMTLKWDATNSELYAEDSNGNRIPVPFDSISTDQATINDLTAELDRTSDQSFTASGEDAIVWDSRDIDTDIYSYDTSTDELEVLTAGDYTIAMAVELRNISDQDSMRVEIFINGTLNNYLTGVASGTRVGINGAETVKDLAVNDKIKIAVDGPSGGTIYGGDPTFATVTREG